ncbi:MAG: hypothetical protein WAO35_04190 [Terriglobia bacterium]
MNNNLLHVIRTANREIQAFIDLVSQDGAKVLEFRAAGRRLTKVDLQLKQVARSLAAPRSTTPTAKDELEVLMYRENLKALKNALETLQFSLLTEKSRLENVRANLHAACAWAMSLREIS